MDRCREFCELVRSTDDRRQPGGRAILDRQTIHVHDIAGRARRLSFRKLASDRAEARAFGLFLLYRLLREGVAIGVIRDSPHGSSTVYR